MTEVYFDGASAGHPGPSGAGIFINDKKGRVKQFSIPLGIMSNHEAEFHAFIIALKLCLENQLKTASFRTDSKLIDDAVQKMYVKREPFASLLKEAEQYMKQFDLFFIKWIPSKQNKVADQLAKLAIQKNDQFIDHSSVFR